MDDGAEHELADAPELTRVADRVTWRRAVIAGILFAVLITAAEFFLGHLQGVQYFLELLWESAKAVFVTGVLVLAIVIWTLAKRADRLSDFSANLSDRIEAKISEAAKKFFRTEGKQLIQNTIASDALEAFSLGAPGSERRYRLVIDHLKSLAGHPRALDPAITYLIERNIYDVNEELRALTNTQTPFLLNGVEQIELSRRALDATEHEVHFIDVEPSHDIDIAWSRPFHGYISEICANSRVVVRRQTIICQEAKAMLDASTRSGFLQKQIEYMKDKNFRIFIVSKTSAPRVFGNMDWRFEVYDSTAVRIRQEDRYEDEQQLDVTVLNAKDGYLAGILKHIGGHAIEVY